MSVSEGGGRILCDGEGCQASVALGPELDFDWAFAGWTAVLEDDDWRHYCPRCSGSAQVDTRAREGGKEI